MSRKASHLRAALFATALICAGSGSGLASEPVLAQTTSVSPTVRVATAAFDDATPMLYAQRMGWFQRAGLDVQLTRRTTSGAVTLAAVLGGTYDIAKVDMLAAIDAHVKGVPIVVIAPAAIYNSRAPIGGLLVLKDSPISTAKDFNGKIVAEPSLGDIGAVMLDTWMDQNGGDWRSIRYVELPMGAIPAGVEGHRVDAGTVEEPIAGTALASGNFRLINAWSAIAPTYLLSVWVTTRDWADKHPAILKTLASVLARSAAYTNTHHAETAAMFADFSAVPIEQVKSMTRITSGTTLRASLVQPVIEAAVRDHSITRSFRAEDLIDVTPRP